MSSVPWSPYQASAFWARYVGGVGLAAIASASTRVVVTRLSRRLLAHFCECGLPIVGEPATLTTTSTPSRTPASRTPAAGSQVTSSGACAGWRTSRSTSSPRALSASTRWRPRNPAAPATMNRTLSLNLEGAGLEAHLHVAQEPGGVRSVDQPLVVGEREVDHLPHRDRLAEVGIVDHDGPFDD